LQKVVIYGSGQVGAFAAYIFSYSRDVQVVGFLDDDQQRWGQECEGLPVLGDGSLLPKLLQQGVGGALPAIGSNRARGRVAARLEDQGFRLVSAVHPSAHISPRAQLGGGAIVGPGAIISLHSTVGRCAYIGIGALISHDVSVGDDVLISVGCVIAARVDVESGAFIGAGARLVPAEMGQNVRLKIGANAVVGAGAVVLADVPPRAVAVGAPAKVVRYVDAAE